MQRRRQVAGIFQQGWQTQARSSTPEHDGNFGPGMFWRHPRFASREREHDWIFSVQNSRWLWIVRLRCAAATFPRHSQWMQISPQNHGPQFSDVEDSFTNDKKRHFVHLVSMKKKLTADLTWKTHHHIIVPCHLRGLQIFATFPSCFSWPETWEMWWRFVVRLPDASLTERVAGMSSCNPEFIQGCILSPVIAAHWLSYKVVSHLWRSRENSVLG